MNEMDIENNQFLHYLPESEEVHFIVKDARQIENSSNCIKSNSAAALFPSLELESKKRRFDFSAKV